MLDKLALDFEVAVVNVAVAAVDADGDGVEFQAEFKFGIERHVHRAVVAVAQVHVVAVLADGKVRCHVEVHEVEAEAHGRDEVDERVLAEEFPCEHPVHAVREPLDVVQGHLFGVAGRLACYVVSFGGAFRNLGRSQVDVEPGEELLVLRTDVQVQPDIPVVERGILQCAGIAFGRARAVLYHVARIDSRNGVHVVVETVEHAAVVSAEGDEPADMVLLVETVFRICERACRERECAEERDQVNYFCLHTRLRNK